MASLAESLAQLGPARGPERCPIAQLPTKLAREDALALGMALLDANVTAVDLSRVLQANGHLISADAVRRHRRAACMCPRPLAAA